MKNNRTSTPINLPRSRCFLALIAGFCLALLTTVSGVHAQTAYVSSGSGDATNSATWSPPGVPGSLDTIEITSGKLVTNTLSQNLIGAVTIDAGGTFALSQSMTVGTVTNNGTLNLNVSTSSGRTLTMNGNFVNNGTITGASGHLATLKFASNSVTSLWLGSGDISGARCELVVNAGATVDISGLTTPLKFASSTTVALASTINGTLITGTQVINGNGNTACTFANAAGGTLVTANPNGLINGTSGTFNFAGAVTLSPGANYTFNGTSAQVTTGLPATVNNLTITNAAGVTLSAATAVTNMLALNGGVLTTTSSTTPTTAAVTSLSGSYVSGPLALVYASAGAQTFPIGAGGNERQVTLNYTALTGSSTVTVQQFEAAMGGTVPSGTTQFGSRYWTLSQSGGSGMTYSLTVDGTGFTPLGTPVLLQQGTPDNSYATTFATPNYTATGLTTFGSFTLGDYAPSAKIFVKAGNTTSMDNPASWVNGAVPGAFDTALINTVSVLASPNNYAPLGASAAWYGLMATNWSAAAGFVINDSGGTLTLGPGGLLGVNVNHSMTVNCALALTTDEAWDWSGTGGTLTLSNTMNNGGYQLTLSGSRPISVAGSVSGGGGLVKVGANTVTLAGTNIYTGNTTINAGKLALTGSGSIATTPMITIATNATFDVSGVSTSPYVNPGGRTLAFNIDKTGGNRTQGQLALGGVNLTYGGSLTVTKTGTDTLTNGDSFTLVTTTNGSTFSGWFSSVSLPSLASGISWDTNKLATSGVLDIYPFTTTVVALSTPTNSAAVIPAAKLANHAISSRAGAAYPTGWTATATTPGNGTASVDGSGNLTYTPNANFSGNDSFTLIFQDGHGKQTMAVSVTVGSGNSVGANATFVGQIGSDFVVTFAGIPGYLYTVETNSVMMGAGWTKEFNPDPGAVNGNYTPNAGGSFSITNNLGEPSLYLRTVYPAY
jgi:fibronectin-binding autotransporter adhesin